jgi:predicted Rossmann fold nucleotide-binding protein DprA/Smf involved in DNA uptake
MPLTPDALTLLLLCSHLGLDEAALQPLTLREWNPLSRKLQAASLRPADLLTATEATLAALLPAGEIERISQLTARGDTLQRELERLARHGIFTLTRLEPDYPQHYSQRLKDAAPPVLFYAGEKALLGQPGIAVVGSRHLDAAGQACAQWVGSACGLSGQVLYSGGAKGVDTLSMEAALEARGTAVAILADSLEKVVRTYKTALQRGDLCLVSPYSPNAGFSVGAAMGRNRLIYTLADYAIVVASDAESGGTWAGATETIKNNWVPVFVLEHPAMPEGNQLLLQKGALPFPHPFQESPLKLAAWLEEKASGLPKQASQPTLF